MDSNNCFKRNMKREWNDNTVSEEYVEPLKTKSEHKYHVEHNDHDNHDDLGDDKDDDDEKTVETCNEW